MKKIILIMILLIAFASFSSFLVSQDDEYRDIVLKIAIGTVEMGVAEWGTNDIWWDRVRPGMVLREDEYLKTGNNSNATLEIGEDLVKIDESTTLILHYIDDGGTALTILSGSILIKAEQLLKGGTFNVNTPTAVAGVRGTSFKVGYNRRTTEGTVLVSDGIVEVGNQTVKNKSVLLSRNQKISLFAGDDPTKAAIVEVIPVLKDKSSLDLINEKIEINTDLFDDDIDIVTDDDFELE